jgi:serine/threonine protein kinase
MSGTNRFVDDDRCRFFVFQMLGPLLGRGTYGVVHIALDTETGSMVAIKRLSTNLAKKEPLVCSNVLSFVRLQFETSFSFLSSSCRPLYFDIN